ncbi:DMT family transporter [Microbulbifer sp. CNSA002]|uniref:DMT family transporter n=1 Tax=Microbulbifer sp. CNSA002 TaxID=3373604 RepID=UPI0039B38BF6
MIGLMLLAVLSGVALSTQAAINGKFGESVGVVQSALFTFGIGAVVMGLLVFFFGKHSGPSILSVPKWQLTGALFGIFYMIVVVAVVPRIGVASTTIATIFGQMSMSLIIDTQGWFTNPSIPLSSWRIAAMVCVVLALICNYLANRRAPVRSNETLQPAIQS